MKLNRIAFFLCAAAVTGLATVSCSDDAQEIITDESQFTEVFIGKSGIKNAGYLNDDQQKAINIDLRKVLATMTTVADGESQSEAYMVEMKDYAQTVVDKYAKEYNIYNFSAEIATNRPEKSAEIVPSFDYQRSAKVVSLEVRENQKDLTEEERNKLIKTLDSCIITKYVNCNSTKADQAQAKANSDAILQAIEEATKHESFKIKDADLKIKDLRVAIEIENFVKGAEKQDTLKLYLPEEYTIATSEYVSGSEITANFAGPASLVYIEESKDYALEVPNEVLGFQISDKGELKFYAPTIEEVKANPDKLFFMDQATFKEVFAEDAWWNEKSKVALMLQDTDNKSVVEKNGNKKVYTIYPVVFRASVATKKNDKGEDIEYVVIANDVNAGQSYEQVEEDKYGKPVYKVVSPADVFSFTLQ